MSKITTVLRIAVLASGNGTDLQPVIDQLKAGEMPNVELAVVVSNKKDAGALEKAKKAGYTALFVDPKNKKIFPTREEYDAKLVRILQERNVDLICLMGYMKILTPRFIHAFPKKIINVHPALLPKFGGKGFFGDSVHKAVLESGEKESGCTIHYVEEDVDTGPVIAQKKVKVTPDDTPTTLKVKVQELEKKLYPKVIKQLAEERGRKNER